MAAASFTVLLSRTRTAWLSGSRDAWAHYVACARRLQAASDASASRVPRPPARHLTTNAGRTRRR